jgi:hypothetical protein
MPTKLNDAGELVSVPQAGQMWRVYPNRYRTPERAIEPTDHDSSIGGGGGYQTMVSWEAARHYLVVAAINKRDAWQEIIDNIYAMTPPETPTNQPTEGSAVSAYGGTGSGG